MKYYLQLQFKRIRRWFEEIGLHPFIGCILTIGGFVIGSNYLFYKTDYAIWIYLFIILSLLFDLGESGRIRQLKLLFRTSDFQNIRILENALLSIPFVVFLSVTGHLVYAGITLLVSVLMPLISIRKFWHLTIPTPFKYYPFEYIVGFRKTVLLILGICFVTFKAIQVDNYNLAIAMLALLFLTNMSFYLKPEQKYFVWIFSDKSNGFIKKKILAAMLCATILGLPLMTTILLTFPAQWITTVVIYFLGYVFIGSIIMAKYSAYPNEIGIPQAVLYAICFWFPPMLLIAIPLFYKHAHSKLRQILE